jgi:hypothetical protein
MLLLHQVDQEGVRVGRTSGNVRNVKCRHVWNLPNESPVYKDYILTKKGYKIKINTQINE